MAFPAVTKDQWRAQVEKELAGKSFERTLVTETIEGLSIEPLYIDAPKDPAVREARTEPFRICVRASGNTTAIKAELSEGAEACWVPLGDVLIASQLADAFYVFDVPTAIAEIVSQLKATSDVGLLLTEIPAGASFVLNPIGELPLDFLTQLAKRAPILASTLADHDAGSDAVLEIAIALSTGVQFLKAFGTELASQIAFQIAVGQDTFLELCKVRALRACWQKVLTASGVSPLPKTLVHAVCSSRTLTVRDPWVNMLRVTTQVVSAVLGGADLVTPATYDRAFETSQPSAQARRIARNTALVLREESFLGKVSDPAGGSYYLDTLTDSLARAAWDRFRTIEQTGGIAEARKNGSIGEAIETTWKARVDGIAKRKTAIVGVSEFANLTETLPHPLPQTQAGPTRRDSSAFEDLRSKADALKTPPEALLVTLGPLAETRPRVGFATGFFAAGGIRSREVENAEGESPLACLCGSDERYAAEAVAKVRELKAAGCKQVWLAGRPGALEAELREAGVDGFLFVGCDVVTTLSDLLDKLS